MYFLLFHVEEKMLSKLFKLCNVEAPGFYMSTVLDPVTFGDRTSAL